MCNLKKMVESFYSNEYHLIDAKKYCNYDIYRVKIAVRLLKEILPYPVFVESLFDYLASIVRSRNTYECFMHLKRYDCFRYEPSYSYCSSIGNFNSIIESKGLTFNTPFRILEIYKVKSRYGDAYNMIFCNYFGEKSKVWLPKSCFDSIRSVVPPIGYDFYKNRVYFRIVLMLEYNRNKYPKIEVKKVI